MFFENASIIKKGYSLNNKWRILFERKEMTIRQISLDADPKFFCIGSCFAENVRRSLEKNGQKCYPNYHNLKFDKTNQMVDLISFGFPHMSYYSTSSILQELNRSLGNSKEYQPLEISGLSIKDGKKVLETDSKVFQDPYRREVFSNIHLDINQLSQNISNCIKEGLEKSNVFIITLGLVEIFKSKNGLIYNQYPGYMGCGYEGADMSFHKMDHSEVYNDLKEIILSIKSININNKIIFSVSPVPLQLTFTNNDIFEANMYSKSTIRSAVENVIDPDNGVYYFPAYEIAMNLGADFFQDRDKRHPKEEMVDTVVNLFLKSTGF